MINSQPEAYLILDDFAIFYPNDFNANALLPSFTFIGEPVKTADLPGNRKTKVCFASNGKYSIAIIESNETTDIRCLLFLPNISPIRNKLTNICTTKALYRFG